MPRFAPRAAARSIDVLVAAALLGALGRGIGTGPAWLILGALAVLAMFVAGDLTGGTLGKRALGLVVVGPDGGRPTLRQAVLRESFTLLGAIPFAGPLLALAAWGVMARGIASSESGQGWHDHLAGGTGVVRR